MRVKIEYVAAGSLKPAPYNPRQMDGASLSALARLLDEHGFVAPVVARREDKLLIGGHQRIKANAIREKPDKLVPCIFLEGISDDRVKALTVALNNPATQGRFDAGMLGELLAGIDTSELDLPAATGLAEAEIVELTAALEECEPDTLRLGATFGTGDDDGAQDDKVVVILEMAPQTYRSLRPQLDKLMSAHDLTCHVRLDS